MTSLQYMDGSFIPPSPPEKPVEAQPERSLLSLAGDAFRDVSVGHQIWNAFTNTPWEDDPDFELTPEIFKANTDGIPREFQEELMRSDSLLELQHRAGEIRERMETRRLLAQHGYKGMALTFGAAMMDPVYLSAIGFTGGLGLIPKAGQVAGATRGAIRARAAFRGLGVAATLDAPIEATRYALDPMTDFNDLLFNMAAAGALTSGLGAAFPSITGFSPKWRQIQRQLDAEEMVRMADGGVPVAAGTSAPTVKPHFPEDGAVPASTKKDLMTFMHAELAAGARSMGLPVRKTLPGGRSVPLSKGELMVSMRDARPDMFSIGPEELSMPMPEGLSDEARRIYTDSQSGTYTPEMDIERLGPIGRIFAKIPGLGPVTLHAQSSINPRVRNFMNRVTENPIRAGVRDAESIADANFKRAQTPLHQQLSRLNRKEREFFEANAVEMRRLGLSKEEIAKRTGSAKLADTMEAFNNGIKFAHELVESSGMKLGSKYDPTYVSRMWDSIKVRAIDAKYGSTTANRLLTKSFMEANEKATKEKAEIMAEGVLRYARDPENYVSRRVTDGKASEKLAAIKEFMKGKGLDDENIAAVLEIISPKHGLEIPFGFGAGRVNFNENAVLTGVKNLKTGKLEDVKFGDLTNNSAMLFYNRYTKAATGMKEWKTLTSAIDPEGMGKLEFPTLNDSLTWMKGGGEVDDKTIAGLEVAYRTLMGAPAWDPILKQGGKGREFLRLTQDIGFINAMNAVAIAQFPEVYAMMATNGIRHTLINVPEMLAVTRSAKDGKLSVPLLAEIEAMGIGGSVLREDALHRHGLETGLGFTAKGAYEKVMGAARGFTSGTSGFKVGGKKLPYNPMVGIAVMDDQMRVACAASSLQAWVNRAYKMVNGKPVVNTVWKQELSRFTDLGLSKQDIDDMFKVLADPNVVEVKTTSFGGQKVLKMNFDKWSDQHLADKFQIALQDHVSRVIQQNRSGNLSPWMNTVTGRAATQFRQFVINSTYKQLGYSLKRADATTAHMMLGTTFFAYLGYVVSTHANASGKSGMERRNYLKDAFDDKKMLGMDVPKPLLAAVMRTSWPGMTFAGIDTAATIMDDDREPFFDPYMRVSGLGVGFVQGNPSYGVASGLATLGTEGFRALLSATTDGQLGGEFTRGDYKKSFNRIRPFSNMILMNRLYDSLDKRAEKYLPKRED